MSRLERLRSLVTQRMNAAADDIGRILEGKVAEYEEEVRFFREENNSLQHKILQVASKSDVQIVVMDEDESSPSENQEDSPPSDDSEDEDFALLSPIREEEEDNTPPKQTRRRRKSDAKDCETPGTSSSSDTETDAPRRKRRAPRTDETEVKRSRT